MTRPGCICHFDERCEGFCGLFCTGCWAGTCVCRACADAGHTPGWVLCPGCPDCEKTRDIIILCNRYAITAVRPGSEVHVWMHMRPHQKRALWRRVYRLRCRLEQLPSDDPEWAVYRIAGRAGGKVTAPCQTATA